MNTAYKRFYVAALAILLALSAYPLIHGVRILIAALQHGMIQPEDYARYVVPYAALSFAVIVVMALQPLLWKLKERLRLPVFTLSALGIFTAVEFGMENIKVDNSAGVLPLLGGHPALKTDIWQWASCAISPGALRQLRVSPDGMYYVGGVAAYKIHYFIVSFALIALFCGALYALGRLFREGTGKKPAVLRTVSAVVLLGLCIFANTTGFFRDTAPVQNTAASVLTSLFFVMLGVTFGVYIGSFLLKNFSLAARWLPVAAAVCITVAMYIGESFLLNGTLYRFGTGWFFSGLPGIVVAPVDLLVILLAGALTWGVMRLVRPRKEGYRTQKG